jgi:hypothetical protein
MSSRLRAVLTDGLLAGFLGYLIIVLVITAGDLIQGRPAFHTAGLLGTVVFYDRGDPLRAVSPWPGPVLAYNGLHLLVMLAFGLLLAWLATVAEAGPDLWYLASVALLFVLLHALGLPLLLPDEVARGLSPWLLILATALATAGMGAFLWRTHPALRASIRVQPG